MGTPYRQARPSAPAAARPSDRRPLGPGCRSNRAHHPHQHRSRRLGLRAPSLASRHRLHSSRPHPRPNRRFNLKPCQWHNLNRDRGARRRHSHHRDLADPDPGSKRLLPSSKLNPNNNHMANLNLNPNNNHMANLNLNPNQALGDRDRPRRHNHHRDLADPSPDRTPCRGWPLCTLWAHLQGLSPESSRARRPYPRT